MSLSNLLDIQQPQDLLRGTMNIMNEYEQSKEEGENKPKKVVPTYVYLSSLSPLTSRVTSVSLETLDKGDDRQSAATQITHIRTYQTPHI
jgi:hypothetical protein